MIGFDLGRPHGEIREVLHQFARHVVRPVALEADRTGRFPDDLLLRAAAMRAGMTQGEVPEEYGGEGGGVGEGVDRKGRKSANRFTVVAAEELAWGDVPFLMNLPGPGLGGPPVRHAGTPDQQRRFFSIFRQPGLHYGAYGLTEPGATAGRGYWKDC